LYNYNVSEDDMAQPVFGLIDVQCGFMPPEEGIRLGMPGFGELPVAEGAVILPLVNQLVTSAATHGLAVFTSQDWHPRESAHFAETPTYTTTWPVHCVAGSAGAALHPDLVVPAGATAFVKGMEVLLDGADDTSYSAWNGATHAGQTLASYLAAQQAETVFLAGLALDYCVAHTALDILTRGGYAVVIIEEATRSVAAHTGAQMRDRLAQAGVSFCSAADAIAVWQRGTR
jgi:nicotinamidase/pyrazinamidase